MAVKFKSFVIDQNKVTPISIEVEILKGMPDFKVIGLSDRSIREVHDRARAAIKNNNYKFPIHRKIINLIPAHIPKQGTHLDLPIVLGLLIKSGQIIYSPKSDTLFIGEMTLNGDIKPVPNINAILEAAENSGMKKVFLPAENLKDAIKSKLDLIPISNLKELIKSLYEPSIQTAPKSLATPIYPTFDDIINQHEAKRAITIALAGQHKILMVGPPGCGKSVLAQSAQNLIPGLPYISVNGDITLNKFLYDKYAQAKHGLLIFNELNELNTKMRDNLKSILEDSPNHSVIATVNPCKCGYYKDPYKICYCNPHTIKQYKQKLSGPLLDRFDLAIKVIADPLVSKPDHNHEETKHALNFVKRVRSAELDINEIPLKTLLKDLDKKAKNITKVIENKFSISNRRLLKLLQVAKTISLIDKEKIIQEQHIAESFKFQKYLIEHEWTKSN